MEQKLNFTKDKIPYLLKKIAIPAATGTLFQSLYTLVDTFYAGKISANALVALSKAFPISFIIIAFGVGILAGTTSLIANTLGEKDEHKAIFWLDRAANQGHVFALRKVAEIKLMAEDKTLHDAKTAQSYLKRLEEVEMLNPEVQFLTAIAWEKQDVRKRAEAVKMIQQAIFLGEQQGWDTSAWSDVLMRWTTGGRVTISNENH